jgi:ABC-2 type transport system permease protein
MFTIFKHSLSRNLGTILGWGLSLAVLGGYLVLFYDTLAEQQAQLNQLISQYPPELMAMFGGMDDMFTPHGYINVEFFSYMPLILGIYIVLSGSGLLAGDEENGTLDLVLAHPVSRTAVFWGRLLSFTATVLAILFIAWLGFMLAIPGTLLDISPADMALPFLSLFALLALFGMLALLLSMLLPSRRLAAMVSGLLLVASFFITTLARLDENLENLAKLSPLNYYQGGLALLKVEWGWLAGLLGAALLFTLLAWWRFERRDIRVGGEGGWQLMFRKAKAKA